MERTLSILQLKLITESIQRLLKQDMKAGNRFNFTNWAQPFLDRGTNIIQMTNDLIVKYGTPVEGQSGQVTVSPENMIAFTTELQEFYNTPTDPVVCTRLNADWIADLVTIEADSILAPLCLDVVASV